MTAPSWNSITAAEPPSSDDEVHAGVAGTPEDQFGVAADHPQREHVDGQVDDAEVEESAAEHADDLPVHDSGWEQRPVREELRPGLVLHDAAGLRRGDQEDADVRGHQDVRHKRRRTLCGHGAGDVTDRADIAPSGGDAVDTLVADGRFAQAFGARGTTAPVARQRSGAIGVADAPRLGRSALVRGTAPAGVGHVLRFPTRW